MAAPTIVFDLDGTLVDTAPDLVDTLNAILARHDVPPVAFDDGARDDRRGRQAAAAARARLEGHAIRAGGELDALLRRVSPALCGAHRRPLAAVSRPGPARSTRSRGKAAGSRSAPTSSNGFRVRLLDALGLSARFAAICGQDTFAMRKPDPDMLRLTIVRAGGDTAHAVMVGDSMTDVATARAAGIPVVAVDFGYTETPPARTRRRPADQPFRCAAAGHSPIGTGVGLKRDTRAH